MLKIEDIFLMLLNLNSEKLQGNSRILSVLCQMFFFLFVEQIIK